MREAGRRLKLCCTVVTLLSGMTGWGCGEAVEELWQRMEAAYAGNEFENGHAAVEELISSCPGDDHAAARALTRMLQEVRRQRWHHRLLPRENPRALWAAQHYCALERRGVVSARTDMMRLAVNLVVEGALAHG